MQIDINKPIADQLKAQGLKFSAESSVPFQSLADSIADLGKRGILKDHEVQKATRRLTEKLEHHTELVEPLKTIVAPVSTSSDAKPIVKASTPKAVAKAA